MGANILGMAAGGKKMSDTLMGKQMSGTPKEMRGAARGLGSLLEQFMGGGDLPFGRMRAGAFGDLTAPLQQYGVDEALLASLRDPADQTAGLFAAMRPFEERAMEQGLADVSESFGAMGARFSPQLLKGQRDFATELNQTFARSREEALMGANAQRNQALGQLLGLGLGAQGQMDNYLLSLMGMSMPGAPQFRPGILGDLLGAAGAAAGGYYGGKT